MTKMNILLLYCYSFVIKYGYILLFQNTNTSQSALARIIIINTRNEVENMEQDGKTRLHRLQTPVTFNQKEEEEI